MSKVKNSRQRKAVDDFRRWEIGFDDEMRFDEENVGGAWKRLIEAGCEPDALKSTLYYAAFSLKSAQEYPRQLNAFFCAKQETLVEVAKLKKAIESLAVPTFRGRAMLDHVLHIYGVRKEHILFFREFPNMLEHFEEILEFLHFQKEKQQGLFEVARGELLLHLYVEETTKQLFPDEKAVLLKAAAKAYDVKPLPSYGPDAVNRGRYRRWFRARKSSEYRELKALVRGIKDNAPTFLTSFLESRLIAASLSLAFHQQLMELALRADDGRQRPRQNIGDPFASLYRPASSRRFSATRRDPPSHGKSV